MGEFAKLARLELLQVLGCVALQEISKRQLNFSAKSREFLLFEVVLFVRQVLDFSLSVQRFGGAGKLPLDAEATVAEQDQVEGAVGAAAHILDRTLTPDVEDFGVSLDPPLFAFLLFQCSRLRLWGDDRHPDSAVPAKGGLDHLPISWFENI